MMKKFKGNLKEVLTSILPIVVLVILVSFVLVPFSKEMMASFLMGSLMMMAGLALFLFGADISVMEVGTQIGNYFMKRRSLPIIILYGLVIGFVITIAEPDVQVLAMQVADITQGRLSPVLFISVVAAGLGLFLVLALLRVIFRLDLAKCLMGAIGISFAIAFFCDKTIMPMAFDAGWVTTGPITAPFILALGAGIASMIGGSRSGEDGYGIMGFSSLGPTLTVLMLGVIFGR